MNLEILDFIRPDAPPHNLYISGISPQLHHNKLHDILHDKFSPFGLLYEINIIDSNVESTTPAPDSVKPAETEHISNKTPEQSESDGSAGGLYAFVKFYSAKAAAKAKKELAGRLFVAGQHMKIRYSTRSAPEEPVPLYYTKCYELASHYLGFNGWSTSIIMCKENKEHSVINPQEVQYVSGVKLLIPKHGVTSEGYGVATLSYTETDLSSKSVAICRAKKQSYQQAVQNAFQRVVMVILNDNKVYVDINSTVEDRVFCDEQLTVDNILKVNEVDVDPAPEDEIDFEDSADMDLLNKQLLEDLEAENF